MTVCKVNSPILRMFNQMWVLLCSFLPDCSWSSGIQKHARCKILFSTLLFSVVPFLLPSALSKANTHKKVANKNEASFDFDRLKHFWKLLGIPEQFIFC